MSSTITPGHDVVFDEAPEEFNPALSDPKVQFQEAPSDPRDEFWQEAEPTWWDSLKEAPAWAISLGVHLVLLLILGSIMQVTEYLVPEEIVSVPVEEIHEDTYKFETTVQDKIGNDANDDLNSPSKAAALNMGETPDKQVEDKLEEIPELVELPNYDVMVEPARDELTDNFVANGTTEHVGGTEGAIDRMALEITNALKRNKVLVTWLFDASLSVKSRRDTIADRMQNIYKQVGLSGLGEGDTLLTSAVSFGEKTNFLNDEPTSDITDLLEKIRQIPADESGRENVFTAVEAVVAKWGRYRTREKRDMMLVIVTDERGDDFIKMEPVIHNLARLGIRVYCIGNAAVFGKEKGYVSYTWNEGNQTFTQDLPVDQGPESFYPELLDIDFFGLANKRQINRLSSSYGPYPLNRLCVETGGLYLVVEESARAVKYDYAVMRNYSPDYSPIPQLQREKNNNKAWSALVNAANVMRLERLAMPPLLFDAKDDNTLRNEILDAQKPNSVLVNKIEVVLQILEEGEQDRDKLATPRQRAAFDLAMGRALALRVRLFGYQQMLAEMRTGIQPFKNANSDAWLLVPSVDTKNATPSIRKDAKRAEEYLKRVIDEDAGTPWATLAKAEFSQPMGWKWQETVIPRKNMAMKNGNGNNNDPRLLLAREEQRRREAMRRPKPKNPPKL